MKRNVLLISKKSMKPEALVRYWPDDKWNLHLYTYRKDEWFSGMSHRLGEKWISHLPGVNQDTGAGNAVENRKKQSLIKNVLKSKKRKARKFLTHKYIRTYDKYLWRWAVPSFENLRSILEKSRPDVVMSFYGPLTANLIARRISVSQGIPWIAYFRDHITTFNLMHRVPVLWHAQSAIDRWIHAPLNSLVGVSPEFVDILGAFYGIPRHRRCVITGAYDDGYLPDEIKELCSARRKNKRLSRPEAKDQSTPLKVNYAGKLFGHRIEPLCTLLDAFTVLLNRGIPCELTITISNAFYCFPRKVQAMIETLEGKGLTVHTVSTQVSYDKALKMLDAADVNVILEGMRPPHSTAGTLPLKVFDLMMIAKPTVAICAPSLPIGDYLKEAGIGIGGKDVESTADAFAEIWQWKQSGKIPNWYSPDADAIKQYSCRSMAEKMSELCEEVYRRSLHAN